MRDRGKPDREPFRHTREDPERERPDDTADNVEGEPTTGLGEESRGAVDAADAGYAEYVVAAFEATNDGEAAVISDGEELSDEPGQSTDGGSAFDDDGASTDGESAFDDDGASTDGEGSFDELSNPSSPDDWAYAGQRPARARTDGPLAAPRGERRADVESAAVQEVFDLRAAL